MLNAHLKYDKCRRRVKECPCGSHDNKDGKFVPFVGYEKFGFCHSCNTTYFPNQSSLADFQREYIEPKALPVLELSRKSLDESIGLFTDNFSKYLVRLFGYELAGTVKKKLGIGSSMSDPNVTLFWLVDEQKKIRTAKMMKYGPDGSRIKHFNNYLHSWLEKKRYLKTSEYNVEIPLFGLMQTMTRNIAIVESEKTAAIMALISPAYTWMACSGASGLTANKIKALTNKQVTLFPDLGQFDTWSKKADYFNEVFSSCSFKVSDVLEKYAPKEHIKDGFDILDYFLKTDPQFGVAINDEGYPLMWDL